MTTDQLFLLESITLNFHPMQSKVLDSILCSAGGLILAAFPYVLCLLSTTPFLRYTQTKAVPDSTQVT